MCTAQSAGWVSPASWRWRRCWPSACGDGIVASGGSAWARNRSGSLLCRRQVDRAILVLVLLRARGVPHPERVPRMGAVLLCINHPNNLIDSLLVGIVLPRKVHYLATAALFRNPLTARLLVALGVIPVFRRADHPDRMDRNFEMFAACDEAFDGGRLVAIYPEGVTRAEAHVQRIKTGAGRIALPYWGHAPGRLTVMPVGLNFEARKRFRGRVLVSFGEPVDLSSYLAVYREEPAKALHALTTALQSAMEREVVHVERIDAAALP